MKPHLATDWVREKQRFPCIVQPKIDGVRGMTLANGLTTRRLKPHRNAYTTSLYSHPDFNGFDGELAAELETHPDLCRKTASALSTREGQPFTLWWLFDYVTAATRYLPYRERHDALLLRVAQIQQSNFMAQRHLRIVPTYDIMNMDQLDAKHAEFCDEGYEGSILRDPAGLYKEGRCTVREGALLRIKDFDYKTAVVVRYEEGQSNGNEAQTNELGKTFRSTHQENMVPNGLVGTIVARWADSDEVFNCSPGNMDHDERSREWTARSAAPGKLFTAKHFAHGVKDKPRFPTWVQWGEFAA